MKRLFVILAALAAISPAYADCVLREDTASQEIPLGPFVDSTDGNTAETGLTIANTDIKLQKSGATSQANKNSGGATHIATGDYYAVLDDTDTDTPGNLRIKVHVSGALPVWLDCIVVEEAIYDAVYAASATGAHPVSSGGIAASAFASGAIDATAIATNAIGAAELATDAIGAAEIADGSIDNATFLCSGGSFLILGVTDCGTAQSASATTLVLRSAAAFGDDTNLGSTLLVNGSTQGYAQPALVTDMAGSTDTATVATWPVTPSGTITYYQFGTAPSSGGGGASAADVWSYGTRSLTILDEDSTTIDLNASYVGGVTTFDEDSTTIDINATTIGTVTTASSVSALAANSITAAATATDFSTEVNTGMATQASVDDLPTNSELATALGTADDAVLARLPSALVSGRIDASVGAMASNTLTAAATASDFDTEVATAIRDTVVEDQGAISLGCALAAILGYTSGDIATSGANSTYEESTGAETRMTITVSSPGNRTSTITCPTY